MLHLYTAASQPATRFAVDLGPWDRPERHWIISRRRAVAWASCCRRLRWLAYLWVQVYYDQHVYSCRPGHGCQRGKA